MLMGGRSHDVIDAYPLLDRKAPTAGTVGSLDMGGGSLQVAFQVDPDVSGLPLSGRWLGLFRESWDIALCS